ncbi:PREDICTED: 14-3-3-like protein E [Nicotiana attenuata]|uniref:14-3-3-like protein e n=1 Tax=Nicotiana attenuata TaxID=49451 RepID=A0A1J6KIN6_NICAT|nr:PREDICTED: 14-3-3-like protein E [Nicotiana attenuata]OIT21719.1 14-3-3-like protein e [Nicotiana attenuata]
MTESTHEENVYMAKLTEQVEQYDRGNGVVYGEGFKDNSIEELTVEERNILSVSCKNAIGTRRALWIIISSIEQKEESRGNEKHVNITKEYKDKIKVEPGKICDGDFFSKGNHESSHA